MYGAWRSLDLRVRGGRGRCGLAAGLPAQRRRQRAPAGRSVGRHRARQPGRSRARAGGRPADGLLPPARSRGRFALGVRQRGARGGLRGRHLARDGGRAGARRRGGLDGPGVRHRGGGARAGSAACRRSRGGRPAGGRERGRRQRPAPSFVCAGARARNGDLPGAARALEAAMIRAPGFTAARVAWAEVQLDLGDAKAARAALQTLRAQAPNDPHVALLLNEAEAWLGVPATPLPFEGCPADRWQPPSIVAACTLARAERARRDGSRSEARMLAESAAAIVPDEPRLLSRTAEALAQLGVVDRAATLAERARRLMAPNVPALAWAVAAVSLGRGRAGALPTGARPADPELRLLVARASLAAGGVGALSSTLDELGTDAIARDADLAEVARLRGAGAGIAHAVADDPARAYIEGLRARLDGKLEVAANRLRQALSGHGDACRAAGEYRATLRAFKQKPDAAVFLPLRAENAGCV